MFELRTDYGTRMIYGQKNNIIKIVAIFHQNKQKERMPIVYDMPPKMNTF